MSYHDPTGRGLRMDAARGELYRELLAERHEYGTITVRAYEESYPLLDLLFKCNDPPDDDGRVWFYLGQIGMEDLDDLRRDTHDAGIQLWAAAHGPQGQSTRLRT